MINRSASVLSRRTFLRAAGVSLALPFLHAMNPPAGAAAATIPRRIIAICTNLGVLERYLVPAEAGRDYTLTPYLETLKEFREQFTVFSGTSHPDVTGGVGVYKATSSHGPFAHVDVRGNRARWGFL